MPVAVALDPDGRIVEARVLPGRESPGYREKIYAPEFAAQFRGKRYSDALSLGRGVDAITGATVTSSAVTDGVRLTARRAAEQVLGLSAPAETPAQRAPFNPWRLAVPAFFILAAIGEARRLPRLRPFVLAASVLCLGFGLKAFFSLIHILDIAAGKVPSLSAQPLWYLLTALALGSALLAGRLYCAWICPFGAITEFLGRLVRSPLEISAPWDRRLRRVKYGLLLILPLIYVIWRNTGVRDVEPFSDAFTLGFLAAGSDATPRIALADLPGCRLAFRVPVLLPIPLPGGRGDGIPRAAPPLRPHPAEPLPGVRRMHGLVPEEERLDAELLIAMKRIAGHGIAQR